MTSPEIERAVLSAMMQSDLAAVAAQQAVEADTFAIEAHRELYGLIIQRHAAGLAVDLVAMGEAWAKKSGREDAVEWITGIAVAADPAFIQRYCKELRECARQRAVHGALSKALTSLTETPADWRDHAAGLVESLLQIQIEGDRAQTIVEIKHAVAEAVDVIEEAMRNRGHVTHGYATGFTDLDRCFMGLKPTQNLIIAARPSMGKTALAVNMLTNMALGEGHYKEFYQNMKDRTHPRQGQLRCILVCLESSDVEMALRMVMGRARVSVARIRDGLLSPQDFGRILPAAGELGESPLHIWDAAGISVEELEMEIRAFKARHADLAVVCVDHIGLLRAKGVKDAGNDYARMGYISSKLRLLWKQVNVLGIPICQLSRKVEERKDKRPMMSDLRDSGKMEEDASQVIMPYRPAYYDPDEDPEKALIIIAKNRGGPVKLDGIEVSWDGEFTTFGSLHDRLLSNNDEQRQAH